MNKLPFQHLDKYLPNFFYKKFNASTMVNFSIFQKMGLSTIFLLLFILTLSNDIIAQPLAYVTIQNDDRIDIVDITSATVVHSITLGDQPWGMSVSPDETKVYVANFGSNTISVIDVSSNSVIATIPTQSDPLGVSVSPDGSRVYVANRGSNSLTVIDAVDNTVIVHIPVGNYPNGVLAHPDGSKVYVANLFSNTISVIDVATNMVSSTLPSFKWPMEMAINSDGSKLYVANFFDEPVRVFDLSNNNMEIGTIAVGSGANGIDISPDGSTGYVANFNSNTITVFDASDNSIIKTISGLNRPQGIQFTPDGTKVVVANYGNNKVSMINASSHTLLSSVSVGSRPRAFGSNFILVKLLQSFTRQTPSSENTNADEVTFLVTFNETVTNVDATDFEANGTTASVSIVQSNTSTFEVKLSGGDLANLNGTVGVNLAAGQNIEDLAGNTLPNGEPITDETYILDNTVPVLQSFTRQTPSSENTNADEVTFLVTFNETVTNVDATDFEANGTTASVSIVQSNTSTFEVKLSGGDLANLNGTVGLNLAAGQNIEDLAENTLSNGEPTTDETYILDNTEPAATNFSPIDNEVAVPIASNLVISFNKNVQKGTGNIIIKNLSDNSILETIDVTSAQVVINGVTATIDPMIDFAQASEYYVEICNTCFQDIIGNNYAGIADNSTWNFQTFIPSVGVTLQNAPSGIGESTSTNFQFRFTRNGLTTAALTVHYSISGAAGNNDFSVNTDANTTYTNSTKMGTIKILTGNTFADLIISTASDTTVEINETIVVKLEPSP